MNVWRPVVDHVDEQLGHGRLCTVEVDAWFLPDTRGVSYRTTTSRRRSCPTCSTATPAGSATSTTPATSSSTGDDFDGIFRLAVLRRPGGPAALRGDGAARPGAPGRPGPGGPGGGGLTADHLARRPPTTRSPRMAAPDWQADLPWLAPSRIVETFHLYAFGTCRQCGASAELAASFVDWLDAHDGRGLKRRPTLFAPWRTRAKALQFALARAARGPAASIWPR